MAAGSGATCCRRGHTYAEHGAYTTQGWQRCRECSRQWHALRQAAAYEAQHEGHEVIRDRSGRRACLTCRRLPQLVDEVAVERTVGGDRPAWLRRADREAAVLVLRERGVPVPLIAERVGCTQRTVYRITARRRQDAYGKAA